MASWVELEHSTVCFLHRQEEKLKVKKIPSFIVIWMLVYLLNRDLSLF